MNEKDTREVGSREIAVAYGKQLERLREDRGRSRAELAESSGIELAVIEQIERGEGGSVNLATLRKLAGALGLPLHALFEGVDDGRRPFGPRLTQLRERRGWSQAQLAKSSGVELGALERIERDDLSPHLDLLRRLAGALGLRMSELFEDGPGQ